MEFKTQNLVSWNHFLLERLSESCNNLLLDKVANYQFVTSTKDGARLLFTLYTKLKISFTKI